MKWLVYRLGRWAWGEGSHARSLNTVLPAIAVIIMASLLIVLGTIMAKASREGAESEAGNRLAAEAKTFSGLLNQSINVKLSDLESRASSIMALGLHHRPDTLRAWLDGIQQKIPEYTWIGFADRRGTVQASSGSLLKGQSVAQREWFQRGLLSPVTVDLHDAKLLEPYLPKRTDGPWRFIDVAVPLPDANGNTLGVIGAHLSWDWLMTLQKSFAATLPLPRHAEVFVVGADGVIRLAGLSSENSALGHLQSVQIASTGQFGWVRETWPDGNDYFVGFAKNTGPVSAGELDWMTLIRVPAEGYAHLADYAITGIWALVAATIVLFFIGIRMVLRMTLMPVRQLVSQVSEVAQHGGRVDLNAPAPREFRALGEATNQMIRAIEASQSADLAKSRFLADMSHEVRTLLHGMLSHWELTRVADDPAQKEQDLAKAMAYSRDLIALVNDILDLSAIEEGKLRVERVPVGVAGLVRSTALLYEAMAHAKDLSFQTEILIDETLHIIADPLRLGQVLRNLMDNAVKFTEEGCINISVEIEGEPQRLCIRIRDTGIGLSQAQQEMIFGRFEQADPSVRARFGGSGLGLSLSQALIKAMGGEMALHSSPGEGSEFLVRMPMALVAAQAHSNPVPFPSGQPTRLRVLCVDDLKDNRTVLCRWLAKHGHSTEEAASAAEALEKASRSAFDLILMDIDLPDMQGTDAIREIRCAAGPSAQATIYTVSGHAYETDISRSLAAGSNGHIAKPIDYRLLEEKLSQASRNF